MRKILILIISFFLAVSAITIFVGHKFSLSKENFISIIGYYSIFSSAILVYLQLEVNLSYNKRKAAMDFSYDKIAKELFPVLKELKKILGKDFLVFTKEQALKEYLGSDQADIETKKLVKEIVMDILNFYERMSIGILKKAYDEDICYDDNGFNLIHFYGWTKTYINELKDKHDPRIFINFQYVAENWQRKLNIQTNKHINLIHKTNKRGTIANPNI